MKIGPHEMPALAREKNEVAGRCPENLAAIGQPHFARALREEMEERNVLRAGKAPADARQPELAAYAPGCGELCVQVDRALEAHRVKNRRQGVHGVSGK